ncbi:MAG: hypothetical protein Q8936_03750 [Bacillota bacterium]|nr:hypothetical protein [Bacillota bacterium]
MKKKLSIALLCTLIICIFSGCSKLDQLQVKMGMKNTDFDYMKQGNIKQIVIQNTRDQGFCFIVSDPKAIMEIYDILSTAKPVSTKSSLKPDYIFKITDSSGKEYQFNYIAGLDKKDGGNLYNDSNIYVVSGRIDTDIIQIFGEDVRKPPKDFSELYYKFILQALDKYRQSNDKAGTVGIDINNDVEIGKYILSTDLDDFKKSLPSNTQLLESQDQNTDIVESIVTQGYKWDLYKAEITFKDKKNNTEVKYYLVYSYDSKSGWSEKLDTTKPKDF